MWIKATTVYAVKILGYMVRKENGITTVGELVQNVGITHQYCMKILNALRYSGMVVSERGCKGGFRLKPGGETLTLYDVIAVFEPEKKSEKGRKAAEGDLFYVHLLKILDENAKRMKQVTLKEIYAEP